jgi:spore maturation protein SpmB
MKAQSTTMVKEKQNIIELFLAGCRRGFKLSIEQVMPAMILGYALIVFLQLSGAMDLLAMIFKPFMALFGLPGEAVAVLISAFFAKAAGASAAAALYSQGVFTLEHATIILPATMLMGTLVGHYARIVLVAGTNKKWHPLLLFIPFLDAAIGMLLTRVIIMLTSQTLSHSINNRIIFST